MKIEIKNNQLEIKTTAFQAINGAIFLNWGNTAIRLRKNDAEKIVNDIPDFNQDDFRSFYSTLTRSK